MSVGVGEAVTVAVEVGVGVRTDGEEGEAVHAEVAAAVERSGAGDGENPARPAPPLQAVSARAQKKSDGARHTFFPVAFERSIFLYLLKPSISVQKSQKELPFFFHPGVL
ncbi:MAG: hypothetical protein JW929_12790 [Anaerolineales bacterium]|nr:hypothetical protein [Anaerolineales bacterium]